MLEMKITLTAEDVVINAINNLARALERATPAQEAPEPVNVPQTPVSAPTAPLSAPEAPIVPVASVTAPVVPVAPQAPTAAPQYTLEMISTAGTALIDAGKIGELMELLKKYGVESLVNLDPKQYGAMAAELRALGARI